MVLERFVGYPIFNWFNKEQTSLFEDKGKESLNL